jgi:hypothetical protein
LATDADLVWIVRLKINLDYAEASSKIFATFLKHFSVLEQFLLWINVCVAPTCISNTVVQNETAAIEINTT